MGKSIINDKSYFLAIRIVKIYKFLVEEKQDYILSKQIIRCGTSVGGLSEGRETGGK